VSSTLWRVHVVSYGSTFRRTDDAGSNGAANHIPHNWDVNNDHHSGYNVPAPSRPAGN
jgi:hypothetical protein